jgi:hypothetical protein
LLLYLIHCWKVYCAIPISWAIILFDVLPNGKDSNRYSVFLFPFTVTLVLFLTYLLSSSDKLQGWQQGLLIPHITPKSCPICFWSDTSISFISVTFQKGIASSSSHFFLIFQNMYLIFKKEGYCLQSYSIHEKGWPVGREWRGSRGVWLQQNKLTSPEAVSHKTVIALSQSFIILNIPCPLFLIWNDNIWKH